MNKSTIIPSTVIEYSVCIHQFDIFVHSRHIKQSNSDDVNLAGKYFFLRSKLDFLQKTSIVIR